MFSQKTGAAQDGVEPSPHSHGKCVIPTFTTRQSKQIRNEKTLSHLKETSCRGGTRTRDPCLYQLSYTADHPRLCGAGCGRPRKAFGVVSYASCTSWNAKRPWLALCRITDCIVAISCILSVGPMSYGSASPNLSDATWYAVLFNRCFAFLTILLRLPSLNGGHRVSIAQLPLRIGFNTSNISTYHQRLFMSAHRLPCQYIALPVVLRGSAIY